MGGFDFTKEKKEFLRKKMGFGANGGFDFTKELKEKIRKNIGFGTNGGFALQRKRKNSHEKRWGLEQTVDLLYKGKERILKKKDGVWSQRWVWGVPERQGKTAFSGLSESLTRF